MGCSTLRPRIVLQVGLSDLTTPEEVNAIILAEEGAVVAFISRAYEVRRRNFATVLRQRFPLAAGPLPRVSISAEPLVLPNFQWPQSLLYTSCSLNYVLSGLLQNRAYFRS